MNAKMKRDEKLLKYCNRRKLPFTINLANLNDRAKLGYSTKGNRCSGLSKLLQRLAHAGRLDYGSILGKGVMIRFASLPDEPTDEPASNQKLVSLFVEQTEAIVRDTANISTCIHEDVGKVFGVVESFAEKLQVIGDALIRMDGTLTKIVSHVEAISRHIGRNEVRDGNEPTTNG